MEIEKLPVFKIEIDENDLDTGVHFISLVDEPAMEVNWLKLSKQKLEFRADKDKKMLYGVFIMPNQKIERFDPNIGKYYVVFEPTEIEKIVKKFNKNNYNKNINFQHGDNMVKAFVLENFIVSERVKPNFGFEVPDGAWAGSVYIEDDEFWDTYVKTDSLQGFSIEIVSKMIPYEMSKQKMVNELLPEEIEEIRKSIEAATNENVDEILNEVVKTINDLMPDEGEYPMLEALHDELMDILNDKELSDDEVYDKLIKKLNMSSYNDYPKAATENAKIALRWAEENGWGSCGTPVGKVRANQLAKGEAISEETISRMASFERHRQNSDKELGDGCGRLMWLAWGGDEGIEWAKRKLREIRGEDFVKPTAGEDKDTFLSRCIPAMINEGKDNDQAIAMCISMWENK